MGSTLRRPSGSGSLRRSRGGLSVAGAHLRGHDLDRVEIRCDHPLPLQVDGEDLGDIETATLEAERDAVTVLV